MKDLKMIQEGSVRYGDLIKFKSDLIINGKRIAKEGDAGKICAFNGSYEGKTSVRLNRKRYAILEVPVELLSVLSTNSLTPQTQIK
jgi:hypothetical protein